MLISYQVFCNAIPKILENGSMSHSEIAKQLQQLYPKHCNDSIPCPHRKDNSVHPEWDHIARNAEQALKSKDIIIRDPSIRKWEIA